jgi:YidC/Oxa1 family membrane protein insertase
MDRKTFVAVLLCAVIAVGGMTIESALSRSALSRSAQSAPPGGASDNGAQSDQAANDSPGLAQSSPLPAAIGSTAALRAVVPTEGSAPPPSQGESVTRHTDLYDLTFSRDGATLTSVKLRKYRNADGTTVDMLLLPTVDATCELPFSLSFGDYKSAPVNTAFNLTEYGNGTQSVYDFYRTFLSPTGIPFTLHKTYVFEKNEYLFELRIALEGEADLDFGGYAYSLTLGPQIGPAYTKRDGRNNLRSFVYCENGKRQDAKVSAGKVSELEKRVSWAGVAGKYFAAIAVPVDAARYRLVFDSRTLAPGFDRSAITFERPAVKTATTTDTYFFYMGPMKKEVLTLYDDPSKNHFLARQLHLDRIIPSSALIGWLAALMKHLLSFFYLLIPNYGIAIILVALLIKIVFLPLTVKGSESMAKMASLNPRMAEIRERWKDKPEKMNQAIAELYKREKINPFSGFLPLLLQIPVLLAFYNLLDGYFELRGAAFIPGWIPDLSSPEAIWNFPFALPVLGWTALRALPLIMTASQLLSSKFTQPSGGAQSGGEQGKMIMYVMPVVFLFMFYDMPSGLVIYWTAQNVLSFFQQLYMNRRSARRAVAVATDLAKGVRKP